MKPGKLACLAASLLLASLTLSTTGSGGDNRSSIDEVYPVGSATYFFTVSGMKSGILVCWLLSHGVSVFRGAATAASWRGFRHCSRACG